MTLVCDDVDAHIVGQGLLEVIEECMHAVAHGGDVVAFLHLDREHHTGCTVIEDVFVGGGIFTFNFSHITQTQCTSRGIAPNDIIGNGLLRVEGVTHMKGRDGRVVVE